MQDSIKHSDKLTVGTVLWAAPEYLDSKRINERTETGDVFSFGVILWELVTQKHPWVDEGYSGLDVAIAVASGDRLVIPDNCNTELKSLMEDCWQNGNKQSTFDTNKQTQKKDQTLRISLQGWNLASKLLKKKMNTIKNVKRKKIIKKAKN